MHTLNPLFALNRFAFESVGVRSVLRVLVYDRRSALDSRLLGVATLPAAAIPASSGPLYMWLPLAPPSRKGRGKIARLQVRDGCGDDGLHVDPYVASNWLGIYTSG